jgi:hypothetical protein
LDLENLTEETKKSPDILMRHIRQPKQFIVSTSFHVRT